MLRTRALMTLVALAVVSAGAATVSGSSSEAAPVPAVASIPSADSPGGTIACEPVTMGFFGVTGIGMLLLRPRRAPIVS